MPSNHPRCRTSGTYWPAEAILDDNGRGKYLVEWIGIDPATGYPYKPTWEPYKNVTKQLVNEWCEERTKECAPASHATSTSDKSAAGFTGHCSETPVVVQRDSLYPGTLALLLLIVCVYFTVAQMQGFIVYSSIRLMRLLSNYCPPCKTSAYLFAEFLCEANQPYREAHELAKTLSSNLSEVPALV
jgi:hypothetical protein